MDVIIRVTVLLVNFLVWILLHLLENPLMKETALFFSCIAQDVSVKILGKGMFSFVAKDVPRLSIRTVVLLLLVS